MTIPNDRGLGFIFRGSSVPFGGHLISIDGKPVDRPLRSPPASALPITGGRNAGTSNRGKDGPFRWGETLAKSLGEAREDGHHVTTVTASLAEFTADNDGVLFKAERLAISSVSDHPPNQQPSFTFREISFDGMSAAGQSITVELDKGLKDYPTFDLFEKFKGRSIRLSSGYVYTTIVESVTWNDGPKPGNSLKVPGFGTLYFGEVLMDEYTRRVSMVRLVMGSRIGAHVVCAEVDHNGSWGR